MVGIEEIKSRNYNLDIKNPNGQVQEIVLPSKEIIQKIRASHQKIGNILEILEGELFDEES